jgi:hypothetical protein
MRSVSSANGRKMVSPYQPRNKTYSYEEVNKLEHKGLLLTALTCAVSYCSFGHIEHQFTVSDVDAAEHLCQPISKTNGPLELNPSDDALDS